MDRRTYFADVVKASCEEVERVDVVVASYETFENFENFERNWVCCGLFFTLSASRTRFSKCSVTGSPYFVDVESIQIEKNELSCGIFL